MEQLLTLVFSGQSTLPSSCPVCEHSPVSGDDCTVYKSLRTTIRVFLKTEEKKREAAKPKVNDSPPLTPVEPTPTPAPAVAKLPVESTLDENATSAPIADSEGQAEQPSASGEPLPSTETHLSSEDEPHRVGIRTKMLHFEDADSRRMMNHCLNQPTKMQIMLKMRPSCHRRQVLATNKTSLQTEMRSTVKTHPNKTTRITKKKRKLLNP